MSLIAAVGEAFVIIRADGSGFGRSVDGAIGRDLDSSGRRAGSKFGTALKAGAIGVLAGGAALAGFLKGALDEARDAQKVGALTNAVIKSTGGIANVTAAQVDKLATSISLKTGVDDEAIAAGENMLLTFGNVRNEIGKNNDIFNQATVAANDMAAAFGGDAVSNSKLLGKALNEPVKGVSALTRVGVSFTQQQKDQIATLVESGDILGAQKVILREVTKQTGGAAEATATAGDKFKVAFGNLQESVGTALLPLFDKLLGKVTEFVVFLTNDIGPGIAALNGYLAPAIEGVQDFFSSLSGGGSGGASGMLDTFKSIGSAIATNFLPVLKTAADTFQTVILPAVIALASYLAANLIPIFKQVGQIIATQVVPIVASLAQFLYGTVYPAVIAIASTIAKNLKPAFDQLFATIQTQILPVLALLLAKFREWQPTIQKVIQIVLMLIGSFANMSSTILGKVLPVVIKLAGFIIRVLVVALILIISKIVKTVAFLIRLGTAFVKAISSVAKFRAAVFKLIGQVVQTIAKLPGQAARALASLASKLVGVAVKAFGSMARSVASGITKVIGFVKQLPGKAVSALSSLGSKISGVATKAFGQMVEAVISGGKRVATYIGDIPRKAVSALAGIGDALFGAGASLVQGFIDGILSKIDDLLGQIKRLKDLIPGSPVKAGPLRVLNGASQRGMRLAGASLVSEFAGGLSTTAALDASLANLTRRIKVPSPGRLDLHSAAGGVASTSGGINFTGPIYTRDETELFRKARVEEQKRYALMSAP